MNAVTLTLNELHRAENELAATLTAVANHHRADHEIHHVARDLARWSRDHVRRIAETGRDYDLDLDPEARREPATLDAVPGTREPLGAAYDESLALLRHLRLLHVMAVEVSIDWELLAQTAQALEDPGLLALAAECHPGTLRQMQWANAEIKSNAPQIMANL